MVESSDGRFRVALTGAEPGRLAALRDRPITVTGRFHFRPGFAGTSEVHSIALVSA